MLRPPIEMNTCGLIRRIGFNFCQVSPFLGFFTQMVLDPSMMAKLGEYSQVTSEIFSLPPPPSPLAGVLLVRHQVDPWS